MSSTNSQSVNPVQDLLDRIMELELGGANLTEAYLWGADLVGANLVGANLTKASFLRCM
jgi:uncharacterized protein YjbI with pentapeptide repeats